MSYAYVLNGAIDGITGSLPNYSHDLATHNIVQFRKDTVEPVLNSCGWYTVVQVPMPTPPAGKTYNSSITLQSGIPTVTWTQRDLTAAELAQQTATTNRASIVTQAHNALATLQTQIDAAPVVVGSLAQAQTVCRGLQQAIQFQALVDRQLIRLLLNELDGTT